MSRLIFVCWLAWAVISLSASEPFTIDLNPRDIFQSPEAIPSWGLSISSDSRYLASAHESGQKGVICCWDTKKSELLSTITEAQGATRFVLFHPQKEYLFSANRDGKVRVYEYPKLKPIHEFKAHDTGINSLAMSGSGEFLATAGVDHQCKVWRIPEDLSKGVKLVGVAEGHTNEVLSIALNQKGDQLVSGSLDGTARTWKIENGKIIPMVRYSLHESAVNVVAFTKNAEMVISAASDSHLHIWDAKTGVRNQEPNSIGRMIRGLTLNSSDGSIITVESDETMPTQSEVRLWDSNGRKRRIIGSFPNLLHAVVVSREGQIFALGGDRVIRSWSLQSKTIGPTLRLPVAQDAVTQMISKIAVSPDRSIVAIGSLSGEIRLVHSASGELLGLLKGHQGEILSLAFDSDQQTLASSSVDRTIQFWDVTKKVATKQISIPKDLIYALAFIPGQQQLVSVGSQRRVTIWSTQGEEVESWQGGMATLTALAISHDGKQLAVGGKDRLIRIWNLENLTQKPIELRGHEGAIQSLSWSNKPDTLLSVGADSRARLWNTLNNEIVYTYRSSTHNLQVGAISPEGTYIALGTKTGGLLILDPLTGLTKHEFSKHLDTVNSVWITPDGQSIWSASIDGDLKQWSAGETAVPPLAKLGKHEGGVTNLLLSPDGKRLASAGRDGKIRVYDATTGKLQKEWTAHEVEVKSLSWNHDGTLLLSAGRTDRLVRAWNDSGEKKWEYQHPCLVTSIAMTTQEKLVAVAGEDCEIRFLDFHQKEKFRMKTPVPAAAMSFSFDGSELYAATDGLLVSWDIGNGKRDSRTLGEFTRIKDPRIIDLAIAHRSNQVAFIQRGSQSTIQYTTGTGENLKLHVLPQVDDLIRIAISPQGEYIATVGRDGYLSLFDLNTNQRIRHFRAENGPLSQVAISQDLHTIFTGGHEGIVKVWPTFQDSTLSPLAEYPGPAKISADGKIAALAMGQNLHLIPTSAGGESSRYLLGRKFSKATCQTSAHVNHQIVTGHQNGLIVIWDTFTGKELKRLSGHTQSIETLAVDEQGKLLLSITKPDHKLSPPSGEGREAREVELKLWNLENGTEIKTFDNTRESAVLLFQNDGKHFLTGGADGNIRIWEIRTGRILNSFLADEYSPIRNMWWDTDEKRLWTISQNGILKLWKNTKGEKEQEHNLTGGNLVHRASLSPDGKTIVLTTRQEPLGSLIFFELASKEKKELPMPATSGEVTFSKDGKFLFVATGYYSDDLSIGVGGWPQYTVTRIYSTSMNDGPIVVPSTASTGYPSSLLSVIHLDTKELLYSIPATRSKAAGVTLSPDGKKLILVGTSFDSEMVVYAVDSLIQTKHLKFPRSIRGHAFLGDQLIVIDSQGISAYPTIQDAQPFWQFEAKNLSGEIEISKDRSKILVRSEEGCLILDSVGKKIADLVKADRATLSPDGKQLAVSQAGQCHILELPSMKKMMSLSEIPEVISGLIFDHKGQKLFVASRTQATKIYDLGKKNPKPIGFLSETQKGSLTIGVAGDWLYEARNSKGVYLHDLKTNQVIASGGKNPVGRLSISADGQWIITNEGKKSILWKR